MAKVDRAAVGLNLALWLAQGWIELAPEADRGAVSTALDEALSFAQTAEALVDALLACPGVEEIFATDEELTPMLRDAQR